MEVDGQRRAEELDEKKLRADTAGLPSRVDWQITRALVLGAVDGQPKGREDHTLEEGDVDLLETILPGGVATYQRLSAAGLRNKAGRIHTRECPFCAAGKEETPEHISHECEAWDSERKPFKDAIEEEPEKQKKGRKLKALVDWPSITRNLGIFPTDPELDKRDWELTEEEDGTAERRRTEEAETEEDRPDELVVEGRLVVYTDGGCRHPEHRRIRRAAYGVYYGRNHPWNKASRLKGRTQTVPRAELRALLAALEWAEEPTEVVLDNLWVVKGAQMLVQGHSAGVLSHQDLWRRVEAEIDRLRREKREDPLDQGTCDRDRHKGRKIVGGGRAEEPGGGRPGAGGYARMGPT